jgi:hypothetical protein
VSEGVAAATIVLLLGLFLLLAPFVVLAGGVAGFIVASGVSR